MAKRRQVLADFGPATIYSEVTEPVWAQFRAAMAETGDLFQIQESLAGCGKSW
jgi:hypothetical protein